MAPSTSKKGKSQGKPRHILLELLALWPLWLTLFALGFGLGYVYFRTLLGWL